jgi:hypothetical protein
MLPEDFFPYAYFGEYFQQTEGTGFISGIAHGSATASATISYVGVGEVDDGGPFLGRPARRKRREERDLRDLQVIMERMINAQAA